MGNVSTWDYAKYIVENNATIAQTAQHFGVSVRTVQLHIHQKLPLLGEDGMKTYQVIQTISNKNQKEGCILGGKTGKRSTSYSQTTIDYLVKLVLNNQYTLHELYQISGIPESTIYDLFCHYTDKKTFHEIGAVFENNRTVAKSKDRLTDIQKLRDLRLQFDRYVKEHSDSKAKRV